MSAGHVWWYISGAAFIMGIVWLGLSGLVGYLLINQILPLLTEIKQSVQDLGDITSHTLASASDTMELVELRVSQAMGQATQAGASISRQSLGIGSVLTGLYIATRFGSLLRNAPRKKQRRR